LHWAAAAGRANAVEFLMQRGADLNPRDHRGETPLHQALDRQRLDVAALLLAKGAELDIFSSCILGRIDRVRQLLEKDRTIVNARDGYQRTPLHWACARDNPEVVKLLLANGADPNAESDSASRPLSSAVLLGNKEIVELLSAHGADLTIRDHNGATPLYLAALSNHHQVIQFLLAHGAVVDPACAAAIGDTNRLAALKNDSDVFCRPLISGRTLLHIAAMAGRFEAVAFLIDQGVPVDTLDNDLKQTALHVAAASGHAETVAVLLARGASVNARDRSRATPLHRAVMKRRADVVELLLAHGAAVNAQDEYGCTPLFRAAEYGGKELVEMLVSKGAKLDAANGIGKTPLRAAEERDSKDVVEFLQAKAAEPGTKPQMTPASLSRQAWSSHSD
jgi:ankyrin repeat protein